MLAHSLRDAGTTKKLGILITPDSVSAEVIAQLEASLQIPETALAAFIANLLMDSLSSTMSYVWTV